MGVQVRYGQDTFIFAHQHWLVVTIDIIKNAPNVGIDDVAEPAH